MGRLNPEIGVLQDLIRTFLADYLHLIEKDAAALLDLDCVTFPEVPLEGAGVVAQVPVREGRELAAVLVRIELAMPAPAAVTLWMSRTLRELRLPYGTPVLGSLLFLRGGRPGVGLESGPLAQLRGLELGRLYFTAFGVSGAGAEYYLSRPEPLAWVLAALMRPARRSLEEHTRLCLEKIDAAAVGPDRRRLLRRGVEVLLASAPWKLPEDPGFVPQPSGSFPTRFSS